MSLKLINLILICLITISCSKPKNTDMVFVEGGTFDMGNENYVHSVSVSDFYIGKTEVTQDQWEKIMGSNPSHFGGGNNPVEQVSWYDAIEYCNKLSEMKGLEKCYKGKGIDITCNFSSDGYRLPTEAEWEYAAIGGNKSKGYKYSGSNNIDEVKWDFIEPGYKTHVVASKKPNELGIYDMSGNVEEWCWEIVHSYLNGPLPQGKGSQTANYARIIRTCIDNDRYNHSHRRGSDPYSTRIFELGFRVARSGMKISKEPKINTIGKLRPVIDNQIDPTIFKTREINKDSLKKVIKHYKELVKTGIKDVKIYNIFNAIGSAFFELSSIENDKKEREIQIKAAIIYFLKGINLGAVEDERYNEISLSLAQLYNLQGRATSAFEYANMAIKYNNDKKYSLAQLEKGKAYLKMGKYDEARKSFKIAKEDSIINQDAEFYLKKIDNSLNSENDTSDLLNIIVLGDYKILSEYCGEIEELDFKYIRAKLQILNRELSNTRNKRLEVSVISSSESNSYCEIINEIDRQMIKMVENKNIKNLIPPPLRRMSFTLPE